VSVVSGDVVALPVRLRHDDRSALVEVLLAFSSASYGGALPSAADPQPAARQRVALRALPLEPPLLEQPLQLDDEILFACLFDAGALCASRRHLLLLDADFAVCRRAPLDAVPLALLPVGRLFLLASVGGLSLFSWTESRPTLLARGALPAEAGRPDAAEVQLCGEHLCLTTEARDGASCSVWQLRVDQDAYGRVVRAELRQRAAIRACPPPYRAGDAFAMDSLQPETLEASATVPLRDGHVFSAGEDGLAPDTLLEQSYALEEPPRRICYDVGGLLFQAREERDLYEAGSLTLRAALFQGREVVVECAERPELVDLPLLRRELPSRGAPCGQLEVSEGFRFDASETYSLHLPDGTKRAVRGAALLGQPTRCRLGNRHVGLLKLDADLAEALSPVARLRAEPFVSPDGPKFLLVAQLLRQPPAPNCLTAQRCIGCVLATPTLEWRKLSILDTHSAAAAGSRFLLTDRRAYDLLTGLSWEFLTSGRILAATLRRDDELFLVAGDDALMAVSLDAKGPRILWSRDAASPRLFLAGDDRFLSLHGRQAELRDLHTGDMLDTLLLKQLPRAVFDLDGALLLLFGTFASLLLGREPLPDRGALPSALLRAELRYRDGLKLALLSPLRALRPGEAANDPFVLAEDQHLALLGWRPDAPAFFFVVAPFVLSGASRVETPSGLLELAPGTRLFAAFLGPGDGLRLAAAWEFQAEQDFKTFFDDDGSLLPASRWPRLAGRLLAVEDVATGPDDCQVAPPLGLAAPCTCWPLLRPSCPPGRVRLLLFLRHARHTSPLRGGPRQIANLQAA
jgi:hypothetical protein